MTKENITATAGKSVWLLIATLILLTLAGISLRILFSLPDSLASGDRLWRLSLNISVLTVAKKTEVKIYPPLDTQNIRTIQRNISYPGFKIKKPTAEEKIRRSFSFISNSRGKQDISAEYLLHVSQTPFTAYRKSNIELSTSSREEFLSDNANLQLKSDSVQKTLNKLLVKHPNQEQLINEIYSYTKALPIYPGHDIANVPKIIKKHKATVYDSALLMVALSRAAGIPARLVTGIILKEDIHPQTHYWVEIYQDNQWSDYDVRYGYKKSIPVNYLPLRRNATDVVNIKNGQINKINYDLEQEFNHPYLRTNKKQNILDIFDLNRFPLDVRKELMHLLLLPLGALITVLFRQLVGIHSYGVFTPTLVALAFVYANFLTTLVIFIVVILLAVGGRSLLPNTITRVPRLSIIFTLIAIILTMSVSVLSYFQLDQNGGIVLLPVIILTSLVDRIYKSIDNYGLKIAINRLIWTFLIAFICLPVIQSETLSQLLLQYPEIHFSTLALILMISLYKGKHLTNLPFLKLLDEPEIAKKKKSR